MKRVLFIDVRNAVCSQMAEGWFNHLAGEFARAESCGTMPALYISLRAVKVMSEVGVNIARQTPKSVSQNLLNQANVVVLIGKGIYPHVFAAHAIWDFNDSPDLSLEQLRHLRDQIGEKVKTLIQEMRQSHQREIDLQVRLQQQLLDEYAIPL